MASTEPRISIVIPVYNEEAILHSAVVDLRERLKPLGWSYEIILAENGSKDGTVALAQELSLKYSEVKSISMGEPNYGKAMKQGILLARGELVICDEIDLCDTDFHRRAIDILDTGEADLVIGSKLLAGAEDDRPMLRHVASQAYSGLPRDRYARVEGISTNGLARHRSRVPRREGRVRQRVRDSRRSRRDSNQRDPRSRDGEATPFDQFVQTRAQRFEELDQAHDRDSHSGVISAPAG